MKSRLLTYIPLMAAILLSIQVCSQTRVTLYACDGGIVSYNGRNYSTGTYTVRQSGQPDIILSVIPAPRYSLAIKDTIYKGESFIYKGHRRSFNSPGTFSWTDTLLTVHGCDSIIAHTLTVLARPTTYAEFETHICKGDSVMVAGRWYKTTGSNSITIRGGNYLKGDSVVTFRVIVHNPVEKVYYSTIKQGEAKQWYFHRCSTLPAGTHRLTSANLLKTVYGCDSVEVMYLTILPTTYGTYTLHLCEGDEAIYNGKVYDRNGVYTEKLTNRAGGDSLLTLTVAFHPKYDTHGEAIISYGTAYRVADTVYNDLVPDIYDIRRKTTSVYGCDSVVSIQLTVTQAAQTVSFLHPMPDTLHMRQRIEMQAEASSGLPVEYEIDDPTRIEQTENGKLRAIAPGYAALTARQGGNEMYLPAEKTKHFVIVRSTELENSQTANTTAAYKTIENGRVVIIINNTKTDVLGQKTTSGTLKDKTRQ